jgi:hypothetical protein
MPKLLRRVDYLFDEKIHFQQKVTVLMGGSPSFFPKKVRFKNLQHLGFLNWRQHCAGVDRGQSRQFEM